MTETNGRRTLELAGAALEAIRQQRARQLAVRVTPLYVFTIRNATPLDARNVTQDLQVALARLGLPRQRFHDLRHGYATLMLEAGVDLAVVSKSLGHSNI